MYSYCLYLKIEQKITVYNKKVYLKDIAKVHCNDFSIKKDVENMVIYTVKTNSKHTYAISVMKIIDIITKRHKDVTIINIGESDFIIEYQPPVNKSKLLEYLKGAFVAFIIFFGSAFTIMTFNTDVSVGEQFENIYMWFTGNEGHKYKILEISYSVGIGLGIIVFFNHFSRNKLHDDPTPIQIEMRSYEEEVCNAIIKDSSREGKEEE